MRKLIAGSIILISIIAFGGCEKDEQETNDPENNTLSLVLKGTIENMAPRQEDHATDMIIKNSTVYIGFWSDTENDEGAHMRIVDITDIQNPVQISQYSTLDWVDDIELVENNLYLGHYQGFEILDVSILSSPILIGANYSTNSTVWPHNTTQPFVKSVKIMGNIAYVLYWLIESPSICGFKTINIENKTSPTIIADTTFVVQQIPNEQRQPTCVWSQDYAFISLSPNTVSIYQVDNNHFFTKISECNTSVVGNMICNGNYLYIGEASGLSIIDITDKFNPYEIVSSSEIGSVNGMSVSDSCLFLAGETLRVINCNNTNKIEKIGEYQKSGTTVCSFNSKICYFTDEHDLEILEIEN
ncbi:MAG: hypothetical protein KAT68_14730 [Bacteroidales bacterium]|nr:hypothetical protein [Bacteroidales bacterium]